VSGVEIFEIHKITGAPGSSLHPPKVLERADGYRHTRDLDVHRTRAKLGVGQDTSEALDDVQIAQARGDRG
jgi:hypothetical protein